MAPHCVSMRNLSPVQDVVPQLSIATVASGFLKSYFVDLVLIPTSGVAVILKDNLDDVYDVTGPGYSNFKL